MEPEISRRCLTCGASVRGAAFFCPECGKPLKPEASESERPRSTPETPGRRKADRHVHSSAAVVETATTNIDEPAKRQRVKSATREAVEAKIAPRVERLRHASNVMLEEASDDPNLRFVLIAVAIFVLALLFLWLNQLLG